MSIEQYNRRLSRLESSLDRLAPDTWSHDELIAALEAGTATPMQMEQVWSTAKEDIRSQVIRVARSRWLFYQGGGEYDSDVTFSPVTRAIETLSYPAEVTLDMKPQWVPPYDPEAWADPLEARRNHRHVPDGFRRWARVFLMKRLLGEDGGLGLRQEIGRWIDAAGRRFGGAATSAMSGPQASTIGVTDKAAQLVRRLDTTLPNQDGSIFSANQTGDSCRSVSLTFRANAW
jgi:hypothetical protein